MRIMLTILLAAVSIGAKSYKSSEVFTNEVMRYGKFEARMYMAAASGTVSTMYTYYNNGYMGSPEPWREIDMEVLGNDPSRFQSNIISGNLANKITSEAYHAVTGNVNTRYHTYAIEWTPDYIAWSVDGVEMRRSIGQQVIDLRDKDQNFRFNLWISSELAWVGTFNENVLPLYQYINWCRYSSYTPGTGNNGTNFTQQWQDDFTSFSTSRWGTANWTFDGNLVDFDAAHAIVTSGTLVLCLTKEGQTGFSGSVPIDNATSVSPDHRKGAAPDKLRGSITYASGRLTAHLPTMQGNAQMRVVMPNGMVAATYNGAASKNGKTVWSVPVNNLPAGMVFVELVDGGNTRIVRSVVIL